MLALKQSLSLPSAKNTDWTPNDESGIVAWWQKQVGVTLNGTDISNWLDSSANDHNLAQTNATEQPSYATDTGELGFVSADKNNMITGDQISLTGDFTIGIRCYPTSFNNTIIADNTIANEFIKFGATNILRIKIDGTSKDITLDSGTFGNDYLVLVRSSDVLTLWQNGVAQSGTPTLAGTSDIDTIGIRFDDTNGYAGTIKEIQIFNKTSAGLTTLVNNRLSTL